MAKKFLSREEYLDKQRQAIIEQSIKNSNNRTNPAVPHILKFKNEKEWKDTITSAINFRKEKIKNYTFEDLLNTSKKFERENFIKQLKELEEELNKGYKEELCAGPSCIYTATDNYGEKYRVSGNRSFRANPSKYGFTEIGLNEITPGDIIQDFSLRDNLPHHAVTFIGYDKNNKALFNYSDGGDNESSIKNSVHYPFMWDDEKPKVHLDGINNDKLRHVAAAYRFIGTEDDNKLWNENYNKERSDWSKQIVEELRKVPTLTLPNRVISTKRLGGKHNNNENILNIIERYIKTKAMAIIQGISHNNFRFDTTGSDIVNNKHLGVGEASYLYNKKDFENAYFNSGYIKGKEGDYGLVQKAVGNRTLPIFQKNIDDASRDDLIVLGNPKEDYIPKDKRLWDAGEYPTAMYIDKNGNVYQKAWDLNDYGEDSEGHAGDRRYNYIKRKAANFLDRIGNPHVVTTGFVKLNFGDLKYFLNNEDEDINIQRKILQHENNKNMALEYLNRLDTLYGNDNKHINKRLYELLNDKIDKKEMGGMKQDKIFKLKGGVAIPLDDKKQLFYLSGAKHEQGGIDITPELEAEGGEVVKLNPKSIKVVTAQKIMGGKSPAELVVDASPTGKSEKVFNKVFDYQEDFKDRYNLNDDGTKKAKFGKILNKLSNFYWHTLRAPKDYSEEVATLRNGCTTTECAKWSNDQLQKAGLSIFGDAWTRSSNKGIKKIYSGYDVSKRPKQYNKEEVINYTLDAADSLAKTLDINQLKQNDIVGLYFRNSPNIETAYNKGTNGETQTHIGHVVIDEDGIPFVVHNVHGNIVKNKAEDLIGSKHPYGITSVYRKELGGQMKNKRKAYLGTQETLNKFGQHYLYPSITPAISVSNDPNKKSVGEVIDEYGRHYLYQPEFQIEAPVVTAERIKKDNTPIINFNDAYLWKAPASIRGNVPYPYRLEEVIKPEVKVESYSNQTQNDNVTTNRVKIQERTTPTTTNNESTKSTNNFRSLNLDFLNEITNPNGSTYNLRTGETYFKNLNKIRRTPYSSLNLKTGKTEYAGFINPYGSEIQSAVYNNDPQGRQERTAKERLLNAGDWINIGSNTLGAVGNLLTGLLTPDIKYARMRDSIPLIAPKINSNVNTTAEENAIDEAYNDEIRAINENTSDSKTALNRKRNAALRKRQAKVKVRSAAENTRRDLINKGNILKGEYDKFNIQRQENVDAYNRQADAAEFNANRTKVSDAITGFLSDLTGSASTITNAIERRQADRKNTVLSYLANPNIDPAKFKEVYDKVYAELYPSKIKTKNKSKKNNTQS